jgi:uncharacterized membrane protein YbhN (UPF0104 family)
VLAGQPWWRTGEIDRTIEQTAAGDWVHFLGSGAIVFAALVSAACWVLDATTFWLVAQSIGVPVSPAAALLIGAVTVLGTALPSAPGYVGTFDLAAATTAQAFGVAATPALALAVLAHALMVLPTATAGGFRSRP